MRLIISLPVKFNPLTNMRAGNGFSSLTPSWTNINILAPVMRWMAREQEEQEEEVLEGRPDPWWLPPRPTDPLNITELPHKKITESFTPGVGRSY